MADSLQLTLVLRPPPASTAIAEQLLAGTYDPAGTSLADISASPADVRAVTEFAARNNLNVTSVEPEKRTVRVSGTPADIEKAFGIASASERGGTVETHNYKGPVNIPASLKGAVIAILGLDKSAIAKHH